MFNINSITDIIEWPIQYKGNKCCRKFAGNMYSVVFVVTEENDKGSVLAYHIFYNKL